MGSSRTHWELCGFTWTGDSCTESQAEVFHVTHCLIFLHGNAMILIRNLWYAKLFLSNQSTIFPHPCCESLSRRQWEALLCTEMASDKNNLLEYLLTEGMIECLAGNSCKIIRGYCHNIDLELLHLKAFWMLPVFLSCWQTDYQVMTQALSQTLHTLHF